MDEIQALQARRDVALFRIYLGYRTLVGILLLALLLRPRATLLADGFDPSLYMVVATAYLVSNLFLLPLLAPQRARRPRWQLIVFGSDIAAITLLAYTSFGVVSGLPILLVITVAASAVLIKSPTQATLVAALAVLATLTATGHQVATGRAPTAALLPAGFAGMLMFIVSMLVQFIARRLSRAEALAQARASDIVELQRLNEQIVQGMGTGIALCDNNGRVRLLNRSAASLLAPRRPPVLEDGRLLADYSPTLAAQFQHWQQTGEHRTTPITVYEDSPRITANFQPLQGSSSTQSLVFIDDHTPVAQQAQLLKLGSLGRLTASIAHEIRNPLGAISHAAQLLKESTSLAGSDLRMAEIIHNHSRRMNAVIEDVMQISGRRPPSADYLLLHRWLPEVVDMYQETRQDDPELSLECPAEGILIEFDRENLRRVLFNLLDNAVRHSAIKTGEPAACIRAARDSVGQRCFIDVIDFGDGVPVSDRGKLFEPFYTNVQGGTGLGLYMCKELCEINNAHLSYQPTPEGLSCFRITLSLRDSGTRT